ncbi:hypothetical protein BP6252_06959 [Coleophoma cylindrospora]|uniref:Uncharacterized protein n=1 Tax=Coleophoma cylindrospora TaxID=1849047 RepID=A0A3D8RG86_9HELO|nr:hypothetical protein BP6252_06959 [Coleophoma cylindrospora]
MKGRPIDQLVYECMFPKPKSSDPQNFQGLLQRQLVPEVRLETQAFYGHLASQEAKYPGLDYAYQPHRVRLSRYPWHRRLFRAFDALRLTNSEIAGLTKWEGTRWAKERFEREQGIVIRDTTADDIADWIEPELRVPARRPPRPTETVDIQEGEVEDPEGMDEDSDMELSHSVGIELNERLRAAVAQREAGDTSTVMDEEWEQWLKDAVEAGGIPFLASDLPEFEPAFVDSAPDANIPGTRPVPTSSIHTSSRGSNSISTMHPRIMNAARLGEWHQIPDFLQNMVRQNIELAQSRSSSAASSQPPVLSPITPQPQIQIISADGTVEAPRSPRASRRLMRIVTTTAESGARG